MRDSQMLIEIKAGANTAGKLCPYCQNRIALGSDVVLCPACGTPHHAECWQQNGGCTTFGCLSVPTETGVSPNPSRSGAAIDDELGIVLHHATGSDWTFGMEDWRPQDSIPGATQTSSGSHRKRSVSSMWTWAGLAVVILSVLIVSAVKMHPPASPASEHLRKADRQLREGDIEGAQKECSQAIAADPNCTAAYYRKGLLLLALDERQGGDRLSELLEQATGGQTRDLDAADECFKQCIRSAAGVSDGNVEGTDLSGSDIIAQSNMNLALTATLRVAANCASGHPDYARSWADTAREHLDQARQGHIDRRTSKGARAIESLLSKLGY